VRVCLVSPYDLSVPGGVNKHVRSLAERLRVLGDEVEIIGPASGSGGGERGRPGRNAGLGPHVTGFPGVVSIRANNSDNRIGLLVSPRALARYTRLGRFDVVHVHEPLTPLLPFYVVWATSTSARVCTFHRYSEDEGMPTRVARRTLARHLRAYDVGIAVSEPAARYARVAWPRPLSIVPNGVDADFFAPPPRAPGAASGSIRILFVGQRMDRRKGFAVLLEAVRGMRENGIGASLDVVGYGGAGGPSDRPELAALEDRSGITLHGIVDEASLRRLMHASDVLVAPALGCESFGMVLIEAMAAGLPVVCSDIEGYRQVASPEGTCLVTPGDPASLAEALTALARAPEQRAAMGARNAAYARQYDWAVVGTGVRALYSRALELAGARRPTRAHSRACRETASSVDRTPRPDDADVDALRET
jgi:phosphatidylinositol alpha-mannosyltransferase